jgi:hypothetical protein
MKLKTVQKPESKSRAHILFMGIGMPFLRGRAKDVPSYACGSCGTVLVEGMHAKQFIDKSRPFDSAGAHIFPLIEFPIGDYPIWNTINVDNEMMTLLSEKGPVIITCGHCQSSSEMVAPNQLFDEPQ